MGVNSLPYDCCPTASRLQFEHGPFRAWVQHANHSATEPPLAGPNRSLTPSLSLFSNQTVTPGTNDNPYSFPQTYPYNFKLKP